MKFILSDESINKYGFRVLSAGIDLTEFKKNPVMFYNHNRMSLPVGKWNNISLIDGKLVAEAEFDEDDEFAMQIKSKVEKNILNATSIGFDVLAVSEDKADLLKGQTRPTVTKSRLLEASIVDIPANGNAMKFNFNNGVQLSGNIPQEFLNAVLPVIQNKPNMKKIAAKLGLAEDATEEQIVAAIEAIDKKDDADNGVKALVSLAVSKGFKKETIEKLAAADFNATLEMVEAANAPKEGGEADGTRLSDILAELKKGNSGSTPPAKSLRELEKEDPSAVKALMKDKPEEYQKLFKAEYGADISLDEIRKLI